MLETIGVAAIGVITVLVILTFIIMVISVWDHGGEISNLKRRLKKIEERKYSIVEED